MTLVADQEDLIYWNRLREGDRAAFSWIYRRYIPGLYSYGMKIIRDPDLVEDAIQDLFTDLWRTRSRVGEARSVRYYLFSSLRRKIHRSVKPAANPLSEESPETGQTILPVESEIIGKEESLQEKARLKAWLKQLPLRQYEALMLRFYQDLSYQEIAVIMNITDQGARNMVQKSLSTLRRLALITGCLLALCRLINFW